MATMRNPIKFSTIHKRSQCLNFTVTESTKIDSEKLYNNLIQVLERAKTGKEAAVQHTLRSYLESLCNTENVNQYYWQVLNLIKEFNKIDSNISDRIIYEFSDRILPYMENPNDIISCIEDYEMMDSQKNTILESVALYNTADRIIRNDKMLSKRFFIENLVTKYRSSGLKYFVDSCASMIDTYNVPNYQKLNITLEECTYLLDKNSIKEDRSEIAKYALEYFLSVESYVSSKDIENYKRTLNESYILEESDLSQIKYLFEDFIEVNSVESGINKFLLGEKSDKTVSDMINSILTNSSKEDIVYNTNKILSTLWDLAKHEVLESDTSIYSGAITIANYISENSIGDSIIERDFNKEDITHIIDSIKDISKMVTLSGNYNPDYSKAANEFIKEAIDPCIVSLTDAKDLLYSKANLEAINYVNSTDVKSIPLNEFKLFKFHNLVRAAFNLDKFLKVKEKRFYTNTKIKVNKLAKKAKSILFGESSEVESNMMNYIGDDCKADICVRQYPFDESDMDIITNFLDTVCSEFNDVLLSQSESSRVYYIINPGLAEVRIKESSIIDLDNIEEVYYHIDSSIDTYIEMLTEADKACSILDNITTDSIEDMICNIANCKDFTMERFKLCIEAMSIIGVDKDLVTLFGTKFNDYHFNYALDNGIIDESYVKLAAQEREVSNIVTEFTVEESIDWEDKLQAYGYLAQLLEAYQYPSSADDEDDDEDDEEENTDTKKPEVKKPNVGPASSNKDNKEKKEVNSADDIKIPNAPKGGYKSGGLNLNNIKLGIMGLKTKYKEFSTKEKEISRNLDNAARALVKGMKDALVSNRREAIIKGSIIPSFSRCIKASIAIAFIGHFSLPAALIAAIGGFALSKKLTKRERLLLLDEIETELEVVDKELSIADSNNEIKKYRELLKYKKDLQRQYQRIKYNIRIGKDILPSSTAGIGFSD